MFNDLDWLTEDSIAVCVDVNTGSPSVIIFRSVRCMRLHALGEPLTAGRDFIIVGGFLNEVAALSFCQSPAIRAVYSATWE